MEFPHKLRQFVAWHRRALAAALAGLGVLLLATQLAPSTPPGTDVVVTTRAVAAGAVLTEADLQVVALSPDALPEGVLPSLDDVVGATAGWRLGANTVVQSGMLATTTDLAAGRALVPIAIPDDQLVDLLAPGSRVSLVFAGEAFEVVTDDARVAALPARTESTGLSVGTGRAPLVLVDVPSEIAPTVAALGQRGELSVILGSA
ncbi:hypothetical protein GCM10028820_22100 [Tessaracoccus terricola]